MDSYGHSQAFHSYLSQPLLSDIPFSPQFPSNQHLVPFNHEPYPNQLQTEDLEQLASQEKKRKKQRSSNWTIQEDVALCKAWINISEDAIIGVDQSKGGFWDRIYTEFEVRLGSKSNRGVEMTRRHWSELQKRISKFSGYKSIVDRNPCSGYNNEDQIVAAKSLYQNSEGHSFKWESCWAILKDNPKWHNYMERGADKRQTCGKRNKDDSDTPIPVSSSPINLEDDSLQADSQVPKRPIGRKAMKNNRAKAQSDTKGMDLFVEEFSKMVKDTKELAEKQISSMNQREEMRIAAKLEAEKLRIEAWREQDQKKWEKEIMTMDASSLDSEEGKAWLLQERQKIMSQKTQDGSN